jgi:predicted transcriptional regulator
MMARIGRAVIDSVGLCSTVSEIVRETGAKPNTVRVVLLRAKAKGIIHIERFYRGRGALAIRARLVRDENESVAGEINRLLFAWNGGRK